MMATIRPYRPDDFSRLLNFLNSVMPGQTLTAPGLAWWLGAPGFDTARDFFVVEESDGGEILGARDVRQAGRGDEDVPILESWGAIHPIVSATGFADNLIRKAIARAEQLLGERGRRQGIFQVRCDEQDAHSRSVLEAAGLRQVRVLWTMIKRDLTDVQLPLFPAEFVVRCFRPGHDDQLWVDAFNEAFASHWGGWMGMSLAHWQHYQTHPSFNPELSLVAWHGAEIAGFCHCMAVSETGAAGGSRQGMIRYVGVRPRWRGMGLGKVLTQAGLAALRDAGVECCSLGVDGDNVTGAHHLYARLGFVVVSRQTLYRRDIWTADAGS